MESRVFLNPGTHHMGFVSSIRAWGRDLEILGFCLCVMTFIGANTKRPPQSPSLNQKHPLHQKYCPIKTPKVPVDQRQSQGFTHRPEWMCVYCYSVQILKTTKKNSKSVNKQYRKYPKESSLARIWGVGGWVAQEKGIQYSLLLRGTGFMNDMSWLLSNLAGYPVAEWSQCELLSPTSE